MTLHREGKATITISLIFSIMISLTTYRLLGDSTISYIIYFLAALLMIIVLQFFRDPQRKVSNPNNQQVLAPADGKVVVIEDTVETEFFEDERLMISIFMSPLNVHINYHPISGTVIYEQHHKGKYLVAWHPKSSTENERHTTVYDTGRSKILTRQIAGALARRIINYTQKDQKVVQGEQMGFIKFGSRVDIYLPVGTKYNVQLGQKVKACIDVIATLET